MHADAPSPVTGCHPQISLVDYPGCCAMVLFVAGCNFHCGYCHNASLLGPRRPGMTWRRLDAWCRRFRAQWARAAVISGGEPTLHEGLPELVGRLRRHGFRIKLDTNGSRPDMLRAVLPDLDYVAMDVKAPLAQYTSFTGFGSPECIAASLDLIRRQAADYEFRTTVIDGVHDEDCMRAIAGMVRGARRFVLQPYIPRREVARAELRQRPRTAPSRLRELARQMEGAADEVLIRGA